MIKNIIVSGLIFFLFLSGLKSQEVLTPLQVNPAKKEREFKTKSEVILPLTLPFVEDFSYKGPYPDSRLWADNYVFINSSFALHPRTIGTATFDALNQFGEIYDEADDNPYQFQADKLTSHPIRLDSVFSPAPMQLSPSDSILLSFYYQPQGNGSAPRERDTLVLEFLHTPGFYAEDPENPGNQIWTEDYWENIWSTAGSSLLEFQENNNGNPFGRITIKIEDPVYFRKDFRFRFRNYASFPLSKTPSNYAGNTCIWNIDYITLDYGSVINEPYYYDIAFAGPAQSLLRNYYSMPWSHYIVNTATHVKPRFDVVITNLDNQTYNYSYRYFIQDEEGNNIRNYSGGTWNIAPYNQGGYQSYEPHSNPLVIPNPLPTAPAKGRQFKIYHVIREGSQGDDLQRNDTIYFNQVFDNYFAYDDGVPETGYGLVGFQPQGALRFVLSHPDTLTAVKFFFNPTLYNQSQKPFIIKIWKNLEPEEVIYTSEVVTPQYSPGSNEYVTYQLDEEIIVSDTIYIGWEQLTNDFLNIGFDLSNNARDKLFYNTHGLWLTSIIDGALMLRPVFGESLFLSSPEMATVKPVEIFPNPVTGNFIKFKLAGANSHDFTVQVFDATGRLILTEANVYELDVSSLRNGIYFLRLINQNLNAIHTEKFLISR